MPSTDAGQVSLDLPAPASESAAPQAASAPSPEPSIQPPVEEEKKDFRKSMRSMLFGEEPSKSAPESSSTKQEETATSAPTEDKASVSNSWPWSQIGKSSAIEESPAATPGDEPAQTTEETSATDGADAVYGSDYSFGETGSTEQQPESTETDYSFKAESEPSRPVGSDAEAEGSTEYLAGGSPSEQETEFSFTDAASDSTDGQVEAVHEETTGIGVSEEGAGEKESTDVEPSADSSGALAAGPAAGHGDGRGTVVIIEDDQSVADYYSTLFKGNGYQVEVANDGVSGVDLCARVQPSVILLDVMMPRQNGILVLQTLRASDETRNTPVVVLSNFSEPTLIKRALQLGALEYVIKTQVEGSALLDAMTRWINREKAFAA
jgi:CheY-like chemotaxis protein